MPVLLSAVTPASRVSPRCRTRRRRATHRHRLLTLRIGPYQNPQHPHEPRARPPTSGPCPCPSDRTGPLVRRRRLLALGSTCLVSACGLTSRGGGRHTVTVWLMKDSASQSFLSRF